MTRPTLDAETRRRILESAPRTPLCSVQTYAAWMESAIGEPMSTATIYSQIRRGALEHTRVGGRPMINTRAALEAILGPLEDDAPGTEAEAPRVQRKRGGASGAAVVWRSVGGERDRETWAADVPGGVLVRYGRPAEAGSMAFVPGARVTADPVQRRSGGDVYGLESA